MTRMFENQEGLIVLNLGGEDHDALVCSGWRGRAYCWPETDGKQTFTVRAETAAEALRKYEQFQQGLLRKEVSGIEWPNDRAAV